MFVDGRAAVAVEWEHECLALLRVGCTHVCRHHSGVMRSTFVVDELCRDLPV